MEMTVYEFFDNVWGGELGEIDINNYISKTTDNYDVRKLRLLKKDIEYCFSCAQEEIDAEYTQQDVENALNELQKKYNEIPDYVYITTPVPVVPFNKDNAGKVIFKEKKIINKEQLLYPYEFFNVRRLIGLIDRLIELYDIPEPTQPGTPKPLTPPEQTTFKSLFVAPYCLDKKINELKNILETNNFTVKGQWRGITRKGNELAYLYHYLKSNPGVIMTGDFKQQIKVFYNEFGLTVKDKLEPGVLTVTKNLTQYSTRTDTYKNFERLFIQWVQ